MNSGTTTFDSGDVRPSFVVETKNVRRVRRLKYTCRTKIQLGVTGDDEEHGFGSEDSQKDSGTLTKTLSVSFTSSKDDDVLCEEGREVKRYGVASVIGGRKEMEDTVRAEVGFAARGKCDFYGVYDGHGGAQVAKVCRERLHEVVAEAVNNEEDEVDWERVMEGCFGKMDEEVGGIPEARTVGSTAVVTVVTDEEIVVANCGDCRAVLARSGGAVALALSSDHKPDRADELERIEAGGGKVINWNGSRVLGVLATSRSIGDQYLRPFVISKPDVTVTKRTEDDEFVILASDGLWDVMSNEVACKVVNKVLHGKIKMRKITNNSSLLGRHEYNERPESRTTEAASVLAELAMARGSRDNISVIVVDLKKLAT